MSLQQFKEEYSWEYTPESRWWKEDKIEFFFIIIIFLFSLVITYNFQLINITTFIFGELNPIMFEIQKLILKMMIIGLLGIFGVVLKVISNIALAKKRKIIKDEETGEEIEIKVQIFTYDDEGNKIPLTITRTTTLGFFSFRSIVEVFAHFLIMFIFNSLVSFFVFGTALSFFNLSASQYSVAIITAVGEELLFTWGFNVIFLPYLDGLTFPLLIFLFMAYHNSVYQNDLSKMLFVAIARGIYAGDYLFSRRISACCLAHILNNVLAYQSATPPLSIFQFLI